MRTYFFLTALLAFSFQAAAAGEPEPELVPYARIGSKLVPEGSALLKSPSHPGVYWTLNDSGNKPYLFALTRDGKLIKPAGAGADYKGILVAGASNIDWEALAADTSGNLIISDAGNNRNRRRDLAVYILPEPDPAAVAVATISAKVNFRYPDQKEFPPKEMNFDSESVFWAGGKLYLLTKHRSDTRTKLYRFDSLAAGSTVTLTLLSSFDAGSMVTDASLSPDGGRLAVLTYGGAWLFEKPARGDDYFSGKKKHYAFGAGQCEGVTFDGPDTLLVSDEERELFEVKTAGFR